MSAMPKQKPGRSKQDYETPDLFIKAVKDRLKIKEFTVDLAADMFNTKAAFFYSEEDNSLVQDWAQWEGQWCWLNPPFEKIEPWVKKAYEESRLGAQICVLVPSSFADWWWDWVEGKAYVVHLHGRLTFKGETTAYPKDCSLLVYTPFGFKGSELWDWKADVI
jgi:phage N-6-adenine-methyltransferase